MNGACIPCAERGGLVQRAAMADFFMGQGLRGPNHLDFEAKRQEMQRFFDRVEAQGHQQIQAQEQQLQQQIRLGLTWQQPFQPPAPEVLEEEQRHIQELQRRNQLIMEQHRRGQQQSQGQGQGQQPQGQQPYGQVQGQRPHK